MEIWGVMLDPILGPQAARCGLDLSRPIGVVLALPKGN